VDLLLLMSLWYFDDSRLPDQRKDFLFAASLGLAAFYALGSGATLFAAEREAETYEFLRWLPAKPLAVFAGKVLFALASTAALFLVAWTVPLVLAGKLPDRLSHEEIWAVFGLGGIEF
jgi:ABC-type transport system involved in multi-copper enzyme maturation permease subunit